jgi:hypothetical protein
MPSLLSRITMIEARIKDRSGLVPHTRAWLDYWEPKISRILANEEPGSIPLEVWDAVLVDPQDRVDEHSN